MQLFTKHPSIVDQTWWEHFVFAVCVGFRLLISSFLFITHGIFPFIQIPIKFNLKNTSQWLEKQNIDRETRKK